MASLAAPIVTLWLCFAVSRGQGDDAIVERAREAGRHYVEAGKCAERSKDEAASLVGELESAAMERRRKIEEELAVPGVLSWAGIYTYGDGRGVNVTLYAAPKSGVVYQWMSHTSVRDVNHGDIVEAASDRLKVKLAVDPSRNERIYEVALPRPIMSEQWCFAAWGDKEYLIPTARMIAFCNATNSGRRAELSSFASRMSDGSPRKRKLGEPLPPGLPRVPEEYRPFLVAQPLQGVVVTAHPPVSIGTYGEPDFHPKHQVSAETNLGARDGLLPGMVLHVTEATGRGECEVVSVSEAASRVEFRFAIWDAERDVPKSGWSISTRHPRAEDR